ncbi:MAG: hypothetical protein K2K21_11755 [Lachnospiraceae bacterium]|nr:hypothetical protein [Lachnospiraceae bacterium]
MKRLKKLLATVSAGIFACVLTLSPLSVYAAQDASGLEDGTAYLNINNEEWGEFEAEWTNAKITGDGSYTVSMEAKEGQSLVQFNALEVVNGESYLGTGCVLTVDSIKINGEEVELQGPSYTCSADGGGVTTRVNIYNEWNSPDATATAGEGDDKHLDNRVAEGSVEDAVSCLFSSDYVNASSGSGFLVESLEVAFTVSGFGTQAEAASGTGAQTAEGPAIAHLSINNEEWSEYEAEYVDAEITGDGTYTVSMKASEGQSLVQFNALEVENGELILGNAYTITVDSIKINGEEVELQGPSYTCSADGGGVNTRVNLYNEWNNPDETATAGDDNHIDHRVAEGNLMDATACLFSSDYVNASSGSGFLVESIEVTFTVAGVGELAAAGEAATPDAVDLNGTYNAYIGLQTPNFSFRNAFDDETYGRDTEYFNQITGWEGSDAIVKDGTLTDAVIAGNGTYTISANGMNLEGDFESQDYMNLIFISTDIPNTGEITISDIKLSIDGRDVQCSPILSPDSVNYVNMLIQNIWNEDVATIGYYAVPPKDIEITFTVSGFAYDNEAAADTAEPETTAEPEASASVEEAPAAEESSSMSPVVIVVIIVVVVAVIAGVAVVMSKKKKD